MTTPRPRTLVSRFNSATARFRVYALNNALEIEERAGGVQRRRVLLVEAQQLTLHQTRKWLAPILLLTIASISGLIGAAFNAQAESAGALISFSFAALCLVAAIVLLLIPRFVVTLTTRRARMPIDFGMRQAKARQWFATLQTEIFKIQQMCASEVEAQNEAIRTLGNAGGAALPLPPQAPIDP